MDHYVVTISREHGSDGRIIGEKLAEKLDVACYDHNLLRIASEESGLSEQLFAAAELNSKRRSKLFRIARDAARGRNVPADREGSATGDDLFNYQAGVIRDVAAGESCVIIGRCADYLLRDNKYILRVFIHAPSAVRIASVMDKKNLTKEEARREIETVDRRREDYYRTYTGRDWRDVSHYDISLNSANLGVNGCVDRIAKVLGIVLGKE